jgi:hypothetical protein
MIRGACHCNEVSWTFDGQPESATACNCTLCRRYGALWIYDYEGERIQLAGPTKTYARRNKVPALEIHFCGSCGCVAAWRGLRLESDGRRRIAVNLRLATELTKEVLDLPIDHFDGFDTFEDLPKDGRCVREMWF